MTVEVLRLINDERDFQLSIYFLLNFRYIFSRLFEISRTLPTCNTVNRNNSVLTVIASPVNRVKYSCSMTLSYRRRRAYIYAIEPL